jgi:hypothetical protein
MNILLKCVCVCVHARVRCHSPGIVARVAGVARALLTGAGDRTELLRVEHSITLAHRGVCVLARNVGRTVGRNRLQTHTANDDRMVCLHMQTIVRGRFESSGLRVRVYGP